MNRVRAITFPIFDWGHAAVALIVIATLGLIAIFADPQLALYMGVGAYAGMTLNMWRLGLAPDTVDIRESEVEPISTILDSERLIEPIGDRVWAPLRYQSGWWKSNRIAIVEEEPGRFRLTARRRDLKIVLDRLGRQRLH